MFGQAKTPDQVVKTYKGSQRKVAKDFERDARKMAKRGFLVVAQSSIPGHKTFFSSGWTDEITVTYQRNGHTGQTALIGELERLAALHQSGALSDRDFEAAKRRLLG